MLRYMGKCYFSGPRLQLQLQCNVVTVGRCYLCDTTSRVCLSTGTKSTCSLATHLHWMNMTLIACYLCVRARACVCVCIFTLLSIYWLQCQGFLVPVFVELMQTSVTPVSLPKWPFGLCLVEKTFSVFALCCSAVKGGPNWLRIWLIHTKTSSEY